MYETSKLAQVISEIRRFEAGYFKNCVDGLVLAAKPSMISYCLLRAQKNNNLNNVALTVSTEKAKPLVEWEPMNDRMVRVCFIS